MNTEKQYTCICGKTFKSKQALVGHYANCQLHKDDAKQKQLKALQEKESKRLPNGMFKCENPNCDKEHDGSYGSGLFCCKSCYKSFVAYKSGESRRLNKVERKSTRAPYGTWKCERCNLIFETRDQLSAHNHEVHPIPKDQAWNKGLTKETDERVKRIGVNVSKTLKDGYKTKTIYNRFQDPSFWTKERRKKLSNQKKKLYKEHPEKHPNVKMHQNGFISKPEKIAKQWLIEHNIDYIPQYRVQHEDLIRYVDFYIPHLYLFIEIDGSYWHKDTKDLDEKKDLLAKKYGFKTLRISDTEDIKKCLSEYFNMI